MRVGRHVNHDNEIRNHSPACVWKILISLLHALHQQKSSLNFALCVKILREECNHTSPGGGLPYETDGDARRLA